MPALRAAYRRGVQCSDYGESATPPSPCCPWLIGKLISASGHNVCRRFTSIILLWSVHCVVAVFLWLGVLSKTLLRICWPFFWLVKEALARIERDIDAKYGQEAKGGEVKQEVKKEGEEGEAKRRRW